MAQNVIDWVWKHSRAVNGSLIVLLAIAHEANRDGNATMSVLELARKTRLSERTVQNATADLSRLGELTVCPGVRHSPNGYRVTGSRGADSAPLDPVDNPSRGAESAPLPDSSPADSAPLTVRGADIAPLDSAPLPASSPADSAPLDANPPSSKPEPGQTATVRGAESAPLPISDVLYTTTGRSLADVKEEPAIASRPDVERLCAYLADRIESNGSKRPAITKRWRDAARLMLDNDGRAESQVMKAIDWCQDDEFWRSNILSMPKLREKYDQLRLQAARSNGSDRPSAADKRVADARALKARLAARKSQ